MTASDRPERRPASWLSALWRRLFGPPSGSGEGALRVPTQASSNLDPASTLAHSLHDLRNLLTIVVLCADGMYQHVQPGAADWEYAELQRAAERASELTRQLLGARRGPALRSCLDLNQVVAPMMDTFARLSGSAIRLHLRLSSEPASVVATPGELERIVMNLVLNARDAMPGGGVLTLETAVVSGPVEGAPDADPSTGRRVRLRVSDSGRGITPEVMARLFEPFFTTKDLGVGLGLSSVMSTARQLKGNLTLESQPGVGTRATVHLPWAPLDPPQIPRG